MDGEAVWVGCKPQPWRNDIILTLQLTQNQNPPKSEPCTVSKTKTVQVKNSYKLFWQEKKLYQTDCVVPQPHSLQNAKAKKLTRKLHGNHGRRRSWPLPPPLGRPRPLFIATFSWLLSASMPAAIAVSQPPPTLPPLRCKRDTVTHTVHQYLCEKMFFMAAIEYSCSICYLHLFQCQVTWRPNDMVVLLGVSISSSLPSSLLSSSSVPLVAGVGSWKTISSSSLFCDVIQFRSDPRTMLPLQLSSGQSWRYQKGFRHSSHPVNFQLLPWSCVISGKVCPCKACLNHSIEELWAQETRHEVGCTCTSKSCLPLYPELPP